jgi:hypothetical protein
MDETSCETGFTSTSPSAIEEVEPEELGAFAQ